MPNDGPRSGPRPPSILSTPLTHTPRAYLIAPTLRLAASASNPLFTTASPKFTVGGAASFPIAFDCGGSPAPASAASSSFSCAFSSAPVGKGARLHGQHTTRRHSVPRLDAQRAASNIGGKAGALRCSPGAVVSGFARRKENSAHSLPVRRQYNNSISWMA